MIIIDVPQRSPEWFAARLGRLTGSRASDMLATIKSGEAAARRDLRVQLVCERLTSHLQEESFVNAAMQRGIDCEPAAFAAYEALTGNVATRVGFVQHATAMVGCSPDGLIGRDGLLELKCPKSATHLSYLKAGTLPASYVAQVTHNLWVTETAYCDFVSFDDRFPPELQVFHVRVERDARAIAVYEEQARAFLAEVDTEVQALRTSINPRAALAAV